MQRDIYPAIAAALGARRHAVLLREFRGDGGATGAIADRLLCENADGALYRAALQAGMPVLREDGGARLLLEPFFPEARLVVLGGGHVALPLVSFAAQAGFSVTVADDRPTFANAARFPAAERVLCEDFGRVFDRLLLTSSDYVAILTRGHRHDIACLERILAGEEPLYTGMIGSRRRVAAVREALIERGFDRARLDRLNAPIGLPIGAATPAEIAVSILAEVIEHRRRGANMAARSDLDLHVVRTLAREPDAPKAIATVVRAAGSTPRGPGAKMLIYPDGRIEGSIGGGCAEAGVITVARALIGSGRFRMREVDMTGETAEDEGMVCGGTMDVLIEDF